MSLCFTYLLTYLSGATTDERSWPATGDSSTARDRAPSSAKSVVLLFWHQRRYRRSISRGAYHALSVHPEGLRRLYGLGRRLPFS
uniref:Putative secreted protein n=1 Tax=Anopheles triannulatus TaxID=58253 RepID=A0A2M4B256_9DIPT